MTIAQRLKDLKVLKQQLNEHPLAFDVKEKSNGTLIVIMPYSLQGVEGIMISDNISKTEKYKLAIEKLEFLWQEDSIFFKAN